MLETILAPNSERWVMFPLEYHVSWDYYKRLEHQFWTAADVDTSACTLILQSLPSKSQEDIRALLVQAMLCEHTYIGERTLDMMSELQVSELRAFQGFVASMETVHEELLGNILEKVNGMHLLSIHMTSSTFKRKLEFREATLTKPKSFAHRVVGMAAVHAFFYLPMHAYAQITHKSTAIPPFEETARRIFNDKGLYCDFLAHLYSLLDMKLSDDEAKEIINDCLECEMEFVRSLSLETEMKAAIDGELTDAAYRLMRCLGHEFGKEPRTAPVIERQWLQHITRIEDLKDASATKNIKVDTEFVVSAEF